MSQNIELNSKAVWTLDGLVCFTSAAIGALCGMWYGNRGAAVGGLGGLIVAIIWCTLLRLMLKCGWHWSLVFIFSVILGGLAGLNDGAWLHWVCWYRRPKVEILSTLSSAIQFGMVIGLISGMINGAFWGMFYGLQAYKPKHKLKGRAMLGKKQTIILWNMDALVCLSSIAIAACWGMYYESLGARITGFLGLLVGVGWCWAMRKVLYSFAKNVWPVFISGILLGVFAGLIAGIGMHAVCWPLNLGDLSYATFSRAIFQYGVPYGLTYGLYNGLLWGTVYSVAGYAMYRTSKHSAATNITDNRKKDTTAEKNRYELRRILFWELTTCSLGGIAGCCILLFQRYLWENFIFGGLGGILAGLIWAFMMRKVLNMTLNAFIIVAAGVLCGLFAGIMACIITHLAVWWAFHINDYLIYYHYDVNKCVDRVLIAGGFIGWFMGLIYSLAFSRMGHIEHSGGKNV